MAGRKRHSGGSWKVAYADFVTAMMAFFLVMWIMNMVPQDTKRVLSTYFQPVYATKGRGGPELDPDVDSNAMTRLGRGLPKDQEAERTLRFIVASRLKRITMENPRLTYSTGLSSDETGVLMRVDGHVLFQPGSAQLAPGAKVVLEGVVDVLRRYNVHLIVCGHSATGENLGGAYSSAWELSGARAAATAQALLALADGEVMPTRVRAMSYGDSRPYLPDTTTANRLSNSRVEFYFHRPDAINLGSSI
jgi:chemotaxis protein MotB